MPEPTIMHSYVFETATSKVVAWFDDAEDAIAFRTRMNKKFGKDTHDWAHTRFAVETEAVL